MKKKRVKIWQVERSRAALPWQRSLPVSVSEPELRAEVLLFPDYSPGRKLPICALHSLHSRKWSLASRETACQISKATANERLRREVEKREKKRESLALALPGQTSRASRKIKLPSIEVKVRRQISQKRVVAIGRIKCPSRASNVA